MYQEKQAGFQGPAATAVAVLVAALLVLTLFLLGCVYVSWPGAFNSDHLYPSDLCRDLRLGGPLAGWCLPGAPYLFPDVALLLPCQVFFGNLVGEFMGFVFLCFAGLLGAVTWLACTLGLTRRQAFVAAASGVLLLVAAHLGKTYETRGTHLASPGSHFGIIPVGVALLALAVGMLRRGPRPLPVAAFLALGALGTLSDKLLLVQFLAPLAIALALLSCGRIVTVRQLVALLGLVGAVVLLAAGLRRLLVDLGVHLLKVETSFGAVQLNDLAALLGQVRDGVAEQPLLAALMPLYLLAGVVLVTAWLRKPPSPERRDVLVVALTLLLVPACNLAVLFATGMSRHPAVYRYVLPCYVFPLLLTGWLLGLLPGWGARLGWIAFPTLAVLFALWRVAERGPGLAAVKLEPPYPPLAEALDRLARQHGPLRGVAGHWPARQMSFLTHEHIPVRSVCDAGARPHACSLQDYLGSDRHDTSIPDYQLVIFSPDEDKLAPTREAFLCEYGEPLERLTVGASEVWRYRRLEGRKWEMFLRAQLAERLRREWEYVAPVEPKTLRTPRHNRTGCDRASVVQLPRGQALEVRFDRPLTGGVIDVSANFLDQLHLAFYRGAEPVGTARVPAVVCPGFTYGPPGLQSRLVPLPPACREKSWDRVVMTPAGSRDRASIGHFLVYRQELPYRYPHALAPGQQRRYEGESLPTVEGAGVRVVPDATASGGRVRQAASGYRGLLSCGPYGYLAPGRYRVNLNLAVAEVVPGEVATIRIVSDGGLVSVCSRELDGADFPAGGRFTRHSVTFDVEEEMEVVEFRVESAGKTAVSLDFLDLTCLDTGFPPSPPGATDNVDSRSP